MAAMMTRMNKALAGLVATLCLAGGVHADVSDEPSPQAQYEAARERIDVAYKAARKACRPLKDERRKRCLAQARATREADVRQAKVEKVMALRAQERAEAGARPQATEAERYAAARARCNMSGPERDRCLAEAKQRFGKS